MTERVQGMVKDHPSKQPSTDAGLPPLALRPREAARAIGISPRKLWELTADQASGIPHAKFGRSVIYPTRELADWLGRQVKGGNR